VAEFTKKQWTKEVGELKKVWGDTLQRVTPKWNDRKWQWWRKRLSVF